MSTLPSSVHSALCRPSGPVRDHVRVGQICCHEPCYTYLVTVCSIWVVKNEVDWTVVAPVEVDVTKMVDVTNTVVVTREAVACRLMSPRPSGLSSAPLRS